MRCWLLLFLAATARTIPAPPRATLLARDWPENCVPGHDFTVSNFSLSIPKSDAANKTAISFDFSSKQTKIETHCHRNARTWPIYIVRGVRERFACDNSSVEFIYDVVDGSGGRKGTLLLMEAACIEGTKKRGLYPIETGGSVDLDLQCEDDKKDGTNCKGKDQSVSGTYISYANRPHIEPEDPIPWSIGDGDGNGDGGDGSHDGTRRGGRGGGDGSGSSA